MIEEFDMKIRDSVRLDQYVTACLWILDIVGKLGLRKIKRYVFSCRLTAIESLEFIFATSAYKVIRACAALVAH